MKNLICAALVALAVLAGIGGLTTAAAADIDVSCRSGYYFNTSTLTCVQKVQVTIASQDARASGGPQYGPVNPANCAAASREMDRSAALCRSYDARRAYDASTGTVVNGKLLNECAKCCRQLREGMNRWALCHAAGFAPRPDYVSARRSSDLMNCPMTY